MEERQEMKKDVIVKEKIIPIVHLYKMQEATRW